jgi:hypothetical protein
MSDQLTCQVCLLSFDQNDRKPMVLDKCGHSVCLKCIESLTERKCPKCRACFDKTLKNYSLLEYFELNIVGEKQKHEHLYEKKLHYSNQSLSQYFIELEILFDVVRNGLEKKIFSGDEHIFEFFFKILSLKKSERAIFYIVDDSEFENVRAYFFVLKSFGFLCKMDRDVFVKVFKSDFKNTCTMVKTIYKKQLMC